MFYSYVVNNTQAKNAKERQIDSILQTLHLVVFQNIDDVENFMGFVNKLISEKNANYQKTKPLKLELVVYEKIKGNFFLSCTRQDGSCFFTIQIQKLHKLWDPPKPEVIKIAFKLTKKIKKGE